MASINISIRVDLYKKLTCLKNKNESFSDIIERLIDEGLKGSPRRILQIQDTWEEIHENAGDPKIEQERIRNKMNKNIKKRLQEHISNDFS